VEGFTSADTSTQPSTFLESITEPTTIADSNLPVLGLSITENFGAADSNSASLVVIYAINENVTMVDKNAETSAFTDAITENTALLDTTATDGWIKINNSQSTPWILINNTQ